MIIEMNTEMLLFRYSDYKKYDFIEEHKSALKKSGYVWMMKVGKRTNSLKIDEIKKAGGLIVLKAPVKKGDFYYIAIFEDFVDGKPPSEENVPCYYTELLESEEYWDMNVQSFKLTHICELPSKHVESLKLQLNGNSVVETIKTTRTAVMFIKNEVEIKI